MRAVICRELTGVGGLEYVDNWPEPQAGPGEVLVDVKAAALNFPDLLMIQGLYQERPPLPFVVDTERSGVVYAVGLTLRPRVFIDLLRDVCTCMHAHGFRRMILLNGHGGNRASLQVLGQELYSECGFSINVIVYWDLVPELVKSLKKSKSKGMGHSGELETSLMLYLAPELVDLTAVPDGFRSDQLHHSRFISGEGITRYVNIKEHSEIGVDGFPAAASAKDGEPVLSIGPDDIGKGRAPSCNKKLSLERRSRLGKKRQLLRRRGSAENPVAVREPAEARHNVAVPNGKV